MEITTLLNIPSSAALVGALIFAGAPAGARMRITAAIIASLLALDPIHAAPALPRAVQFTHVENHQPLPTNDEPFPRADGKQLIIESNRTGKQQVYVVEAASGTLVRRVTKNDGTDDSPAWSHNARWISYVGVRKGVTGVYTIAATGGREQRLAGGLDYFHPNWSPDDAWIMYNVNSRAHPDVYELYVMRGDGRQKHAITHYGASETTYGSWSPDGKYIAFRRKFPPYRSQVYVANADGTAAAPSYLHRIENVVRTAVMLDRARVTSAFAGRQRREKR